jgi:hypothetical protein
MTNQWCNLKWPWLLFTSLGSGVSTLVGVVCSLWVLSSCCCSCSCYYKHLNFVVNSSGTLAAILQDTCVEIRYCVCTVVVGRGLGGWGKGSVVPALPCCYVYVGLSRCHDDHYHSILVLSAIKSNNGKHITWRYWAVSVRKSQDDKNKLAPKQGMYKYSNQ